MEAVITCWEPGCHTGGQQPLRFKEASWNRATMLKLIVPLMEHLQKSFSHFRCILARLQLCSWEQVFRGFWGIVIIIA